MLKDITEITREESKKLKQIGTQSILEVKKDSDFYGKPYDLIQKKLNELNQLGNNPYNQATHFYQFSRDFGESQLVLVTFHR